MHPSPELNTILKQLRLSGILDSLEQRNRQAIDGQLAYTEFLAMLLHDEVARRDQKKLGVRLARAGFALGKTLESFNFDLLPKLNRAHIHDLATGRYIDEKVAVLIVGQTGVGKSHLAQALGHCAACEWRSKSDIGWRRRTAVRRDCCSARRLWDVSWGSDSGASEGARRASADAPGMCGSAGG
jgi:DNA replication protein DnaC